MTDTPDADPQSESANESESENPATRTARMFDEEPALRNTLIIGALAEAEDALNAYAWLHYQRDFGRGLIWIEDAIGRQGADLLRGLRDMAYLPLMRLRELDALQEDPNLFSILESYRPEWETVCFVHREGAPLWYRVLHPTTPPPRLAEQFQAFLQRVPDSVLRDDTPFGYAAALFHQHQHHQRQRLRERENQETETPDTMD